MNLKQIEKKTQRNSKKFREKLSCRFSTDYWVRKTIFFLMLTEQHFVAFCAIRFTKEKMEKSYFSKGENRIIDFLYRNSKDIAALNYWPENQIFSCVHFEFTTKIISNNTSSKNLVNFRFFSFVILLTRHIIRFDFDVSQRK